MASAGAGEIRPFQTGNPKTRKPETGNRKPESGMRNRKPETGIRNPESTNQRKRLFKFAKII